MKRDQGAGKVGSVGRDKAEGGLQRAAGGKLVVGWRQAGKAGDAAIRLGQTQGIGAARSLHKCCAIGQKTRGGKPAIKRGIKIAETADDPPERTMRQVQQQGVIRLPPGRGIFETARTQALRGGKPGHLPQV